ncbi:uncharacterized protein FMAN_14356 [Fusarium mangiferae]|uniref:Epoxide hydrolase N-terminal domain-containing protein n=1 Tax=Fusarium mangiferae TaxID=192010 RepID=A0A1L7U9P0_FUSMA|nr:uncharacterized protein FMAN_14356 [Fusarium mangiferae]CVL07430.1 uncharacterized protein FMAN_14356 [Fusarium mangiferae]
MSTIRPYQINIPDSKLERLKQKLALADFPADNNQSWEQGAPVGDVKRLAKTWQTTFDWRAVEYSLNKLPHYIASLNVGNFGALDVHFIHKRSTRVDAIPLLFLHGWPGSFIEVTRILDPLVYENSSPSFHVIAPSLIDFGFSSASKPGFKVEDHAKLYDRLMNELGYEKYGMGFSKVDVGTANLMSHSYPSRRRWKHYCALNGNIIRQLSLHGSSHQHASAQRAKGRYPPGFVQSVTRKSPHRSRAKSARTCRRGFKGRHGILQYPVNKTNDNRIFSP